MWLDYDLIQIHEKTFHHQANQWGDLTSKNNIRTSIYRKHFLSLDFIFQEFSENSVRRTRIKLKLKVFNVQQTPTCENAYFVYRKVLKIFPEKKCDYMFWNLRKTPSNTTMAESISIEAIVWRGCKK